MPIHVRNASIYPPDPTAPNGWAGDPIAEADQVAVHDEQPRVSQPFRFAGGSTINDFAVGDTYILVDKTGKRAWLLTVDEVRPAGRDVMLVCQAT